MKYFCLYDKQLEINLEIYFVLKYHRDHWIKIWISKVIDPHTAFDSRTTNQMMEVMKPTNLVKMIIGLRIQECLFAQDVKRNIECRYLGEFFLL